MREILFRAKRNPSGEWIEGFLVGNCHIGDWVSCEPVHRRTVGQFTGLTDRNGKKIFEGDILKAAGLYIVDFYDESFVIRFGENGIEYFHEHFIDEMEVIGNIHDNPELLTKGET